VYSVAKHVASRHYPGHQEGSKYVPESVRKSVVYSVAKYVASRHNTGDIKKVLSMFPSPL
jgi:hypothetical protein